MENFADDNFKFVENGRSFSKWVENTVGKGDIASGFKFNACKLAKCGMNLKNASRKIKQSNLFASLIFRLFHICQSEGRRQEMRRYCLCAVMICNHDNFIQSCNRIIPGGGK